MREIKFRGYCSSLRKWVYGDLIHTDTGIVISNSKQFIYVSEKTVGEFTGLCDKNVKQIYEGDIAKFRHGGEFADKGIYYRNYVIEFVNTFVTYGVRFRNKSTHFTCKQSTICMHDVEIIGNIYENPELLAEVK